MSLIVATKRRGHWFIICLKIVAVKPLESGISEVMFKSSKKVRRINGSFITLQVKSFGAIQLRKVPVSVSQFLS